MIDRISRMAAVRLPQRAFPGCQRPLPHEDRVRLSPMPVAFAIGRCLCRSACAVSGMRDHLERPDGRNRPADHSNRARQRQRMAAIGTPGGVAGCFAGRSGTGVRPRRSSARCRKQCRCSLGETSRLGPELPTFLVRMGSPHSARGEKPAPDAGHTADSAFAAKLKLGEWTVDVQPGDGNRLPGDPVLAVWLRIDSRVAAFHRRLDGSSPFPGLFADLAARAERPGVPVQRLFRGDRIAVAFHPLRVLPTGG